MKVLGGDTGVLRIIYDGSRDFDIRPRIRKTNDGSRRLCELSYKAHLRVGTGKRDDSTIALPASRRDTVIH